MVTSTLALPISIRARIGSGPKAEKSGEKRPAFSVPSARDIELGLRPVSAEEPVAAAEPERWQHVGEAAAASARGAVGDLPPLAALPSQRIGPRSGGAPPTWRSTAS